MAIAHSVAHDHKELKDFVIPAWIDDLRPADFDVELHRLNAVRFQDGWATGLASLLETLDAAIAGWFGPP